VLRVVMSFIATFPWFSFFLCASEYTANNVFFARNEHAVMPTAGRNLHGTALKTSPCGRGDTAPAWEQTLCTDY
jgi:hypothetical protein